MAYDISLKPEELWQFFQKNKVRLADEMVEIAFDTKTSTSVYLTEEDSYPYVYVYQNDKEVYGEYCVSDADAEDVLQKVYMTYLSPVQDEEVEKEATPEDPDFPAFVDLMNEREDVIYDAFKDLLEILTEDSFGSLKVILADTDKFDKMIDHIVEYLAIDCEIRIRRPMILFDEEKKKDVCTEYPYEEYEFSAAERS